MQLTAEQQNARDLYDQGDALVVEAFAGTGKTSTILACAESNDHQMRGTYVAYNKAIVEDVKAKLQARAPRISARTAHSLAFGQIGRHYSHRLQNERISSRQIAKMLAINPLRITVRDMPRDLSPAFLAGCVTQGVERFCNSADLEIGPQHLPEVEGIDDKDDKENDISYRMHLIGALRAAWADVASTSGSLRFTHDCYLKLWQLGSPTIPGDVLFVDEAQDVNPVLADVVMRQGGQIVAVGDSYQQIYAWRGAIDALDGLRKRSGVSVSQLTHSFRFGPEIAQVADDLLGRLGCESMLTGDGGPSVIAYSAAPDAILCRTNAGVVNAFMANVGTRRVAVVGGTAQLVRFAQGVRDLMTVGGSTHPELACFSSLEDLLDYVADDPSGSDLKLLTQLCVRYGCDELIETLQLAVAEEAAEVVLSTAHRAKGREWDCVQIGSDWPARTLDSREELRLGYVAVTRARHQLDVTGTVFEEVVA